MAPLTFWHWLEPILGASLIVVTLADVFLTVLYARSHIGLISDRVARLTWHTFEAVGRGLGARRGHFFSFLGPLVILLIVVTWMLALTFGSALIVTTLALTYILHVYTALQERDSLGLELHLLTNQTNDAAELLAGLGAHGHMHSGYTELGDAATQLAATDEAYHHFPVLFFFRFEEPFYAGSSIALLAFDTVSLIKSGLDDEEYRWLKECATVTQLRAAAQRLVNNLFESFLHGPPEGPTAIDPAGAERWRARYYAALRRLRQAGIKTIADEEEGAAAYVTLRLRWDYLIAGLAPRLGYSMAEIDPEGSDPGASDTRPEFDARLRSE